MHDLVETIRPIIWRDDALQLLDQRRLPTQTEYITLTTVESVADAILDMIVRGAPAIGITAAYGIVIAAQHRYADSSLNWKEKIQYDLDLLAAARPTAVNLFWAITQMKNLID